MKHHFFKKTVCLLAAAVMTLACAVTAYAYDEDYGYVSVRVDNAPEGTAYVDLLVSVFDIPQKHFKTHEYTFSLKKLNYENENESPSGDKKKLVVGTDSETAQYIEDGYVSLLSHTDLVYPDGFSVTSSYKDNKLTRIDCCMILCGSQSTLRKEGYCHGVDLNYLEKTFRKMKLAYVDENGHILGVTSAYSSRYGSPWGLSAGGDELTLKLDDHWRDIYGGLIINAALVIVLIVVMILFIKWMVQGVRASKEYDDK